MNKDEFVLSPHGVRIPKIIYGTAWKQARTAALVARAVTLGFRGVDTAGQPKHYHEPGVGDGLASCFGEGLSREAVYLQSKFTPVDGQDPGRMPYDPKANLSRQVEESFESSLNNLRTSYLDCLLLHSPLANEADSLEVWRAMEAIVDAGGAKQIGISNCYRLDVLERLHDRARIKPAVVQNRFYAATGYDHAIRAFCRHHSMCYQSFWTLTANPHSLAHETLVGLAQKYRRTPAQLFFRCLTQIDVTPLTGTTSDTHMREDLAIFEFELTADERDEVAALF
jgi:diketogulonate reductase-like aldo/keto reductase